jgi:delta-aminolevulinic acid dehydratase/porphobilinogen synthase
MLNQVVLVGRVLETTLDHKRVVSVTIEVTSSTTTEIIIITTPHEMALIEYFKRGSTIAIKGRISNKNDKSLQVIAERIAVLGGNSSAS